MQTQKRRAVCRYVVCSLSTGTCCKADTTYMAHTESWEYSTGQNEKRTHPAYNQMIDAQMFIVFWQLQALGQHAFLSSHLADGRTLLLNASQERGWLEHLPLAISRDAAQCRQVQALTGACQRHIHQTMLLLHISLQLLFILQPDRVHHRSA